MRLKAAVLFWEEEEEEEEEMYLLLLPADSERSYFVESPFALILTVLPPLD